MSTIRKVAVIGAGVMGAGIAAHVANSGTPVILVDVAGEGFGKKNALAEAAIDRMLKTDPAPFMNKDAAKLVTPGNTDELDMLADCDWIIEAIVEKIEVKRDLYQKLDKICKPDAIISSNTSTIPLSRLMEGFSDSFQERFMIAHFFNPPRYMRLLELVKGPKTRADVYETVADFADRFLGKGVVECHDTPGFIGNRIGIFWIQAAFMEAIKQKVTVEEADMVLGKPLGFPKTGVFGLMDLVGLDLMPLIGKSMKATLPETDLYCKMYEEPEFLQKMIGDGYTGRKGKGGFYCLVRDGEKKRKEVLDLQTGTYRKEIKPRLSCMDTSREGLRRFLTYPDKGARYALEVMIQTLWYSANLVPEIADDLYSIDAAMKMGYAWKWGPFEMMDQLGTSWIAEQFHNRGMTVPAILEKANGRSFYRIHEGKKQYLGMNGEYINEPRRPGVLMLSDIKCISKPIAKNGSAALWDIGDGVLCLEFTSKMNALDMDIMKMIRKAIELIPGKWKALVIHNEAPNFSVGANIGMALFAVNLGLWEQLDELISEGQKTLKAMKYAPFPVISAPTGMALGGGCEILLHSDGIQAHGELYAGLVEVGVGLIPGWGGCKEMLIRSMKAPSRFGGSMAAISKIFEMIGTAKVAKSALQAREMMILRQDDRITMNRDRLLADAKARALEMAANYTPPEETKLSLPGNVGRIAMNMAVKALVKAGKATAYDEIVSGYLAKVLSGGDTDVTDTQDEDHILELEASGFAALIRRPETWARIEHTLATGKPLRN